MQNQHQFNQPEQDQNANILSASQIDTMSVFKSRQEQASHQSNRIYRQNLKNAQQNQGQSSFEERNSFLNKVYMLLSMQLIYTYIIYRIPYAISVLDDFLANIYILMLTLAVFIPLSIMFLHNRDFIKKYELQLFILFTSCLPFFMVAIKIVIIPILIKVNENTYYQHRYQDIHLAIISNTTWIVIILTIFKLFTKINFERFWPYILAFFSTLILARIYSKLWFDPVYLLFYIFFVALMFPFYLIFHTHLILARRNSQNKLNDAFVTVLQLYLDVGNLLKQIVYAFSD